MKQIEHQNLKSVIEGFLYSQTFLAAWEGWRGRDSVPYRHAVMPEDLRGAMKGVSVLELPGDGTIVVRLLASALQEKISEDVELQDMFLLTNECDEEAAKQRYQKIVSDPCAMWAEYQLHLKSGLRFDLYTFALPVKSDTGDSDFVYRMTELVLPEPGFEIKQGDIANAPLSKNPLFFDLNEPEYREVSDPSGA